MQYHNDSDLSFSNSLTGALILLLLTGGLQAVILPRTIILLLLFLTAFVWVAVVLMLLLAVRLKWIIWDISESFILRLAITIFTIILLYAVSQVNVVCFFFIFSFLEFSSFEGVVSNAVMFLLFSLHVFGIRPVRRRPRT